LAGKYAEGRGRLVYGQIPCIFSLRNAIIITIGKMEEMEDIKNISGGDKVEYGKRTNP
jgi:hypothetical protein